MQLVNIKFLDQCPTYQELNQLHVKFHLGLSFGTLWAFKFLGLTHAFQKKKHTSTMLHGGASEQKSIKSDRSGSLFPPQRRRTLTAGCSRSG